MTKVRRFWKQFNEQSKVISASTEVAKPNIILRTFPYIAGILFASVSLYGFAPFGIAYLARHRNFSKKMLIFLLIAMVGTFLTGDMYVALKYSMALAVYVALIYATIDKDEQASTSVAALIAAVSVLVSSLALLVWGGNITFGNVALSIFEGGVVFACVYIFSESKINGQSEISEYLNL